MRKVTNFPNLFQFYLKNAFLIKGINKKGVGYDYKKG